MNVNRPESIHGPAPGAPCRPDFPVLQQTIHGHPLAYLDNAATTQKPGFVLEALDRYYRHDNANVHRAVHELGRRATAAYEEARARVARFINARSPTEIVFTRGTTESINLVAQAWASHHLRPGDAVLLTEMEHHSNIVPWHLLARRLGLTLLRAPITGDDGRLDLERTRALLDSGVRLFCFPHASNMLGSVNPAAELCAHARRRGVVTLIDAAQTAGHLPLDVQGLDCDFLAFSGHKMCGPTGIGILHARSDRLAAMSPWQGGGEMIRSVDFDTVTFADPPHLFEAGTPDIAGAVGLHAAMDYLDHIGRDRIQAHDRQLSEYAREELARLGHIRILGPTTGRSGIVTFALPDVHAHDVCTLADELGIALRGGHHCTQPLMRRLGLESTVRASFHLHNTAEEVDRLVEMVRDVRRLLAPS